MQLMEVLYCTQHALAMAVAWKLEFCTLVQDGRSGRRHWAAAGLLHRLNPVL